MKKQDFIRELTMAHTQIRTDLSGLGIAGTFQTRMPESINNSILSYARDERCEVSYACVSPRKARTGSAAAPPKTAALHCPSLNQTSANCQPA